MSEGHRIIKVRRVPVIEVFLSMVSIWWSVVLFEAHGFHNVPKVYDGIAQIGTTAWGFIFLAAALLKLYGILSQSKRLRKLGLTCSMILYGLISAGVILAGHWWIYPQTGVYFALCVLAAYEVREVKNYG